MSFSTIFQEERETDLPNSTIFPEVRGKELCVMEDIERNYVYNGR
jgi:hypothetical protein